MSEGLTPKEAYALMRAAVEAKGEDYTYTPITITNDSGESWEECQYIDWKDRENPAPSCIVGHVFVAAGVEPTRLRTYEGQAARQVAYEVLDMEEDGPLAQALDEAQRTQDSGKTWGEALRRFEERLEEEGVDFR